MIQIEQFESGHYEQSVGYKYFVPNHINDEWTWTDFSLFFSVEISLSIS